MNMKSLKEVVSDMLNMATENGFNVVEFMGSAFITRESKNGLERIIISHDELSHDKK